VPPAGLLLEVGGCLRLFGGRKRLVQQVRAGLRDQGLEQGASLALAPTPQGALWLGQGAARLSSSGGAAIAMTVSACFDLPQLHQALDALPVAALALPPKVAQRLEGFGLVTLGQTRRLPLAELTRRLGPPAMALIARAYGELPDPRPEFVFPLQFAQSIELPAPSDKADALLFAARRLTAALAGWLALRQSVMAECRLILAHRPTPQNPPATELVLGFASATRDPQRLERVLRERLQRLPLPAPVESLRLEATRIEATADSSGNLFDAGDGSGAAGEAMAALIERLQARLGAAQVQGLAPVADHRPECATAAKALSAATGVATAFQPDPAAKPRPFWLLAHPLPVANRDGRPSLGGPLSLLAGPERIESGWWDGGQAHSAAPADLRRDYFIAQTADHRWAWIFRDLKPPGGWFLHGWFA